MLILNFSDHHLRYFKMFIYEVVIFQILVFNISILILIWYDFLTPQLTLKMECQRAKCKLKSSIKLNLFTAHIMCISVIQHSKCCNTSLVCVLLMVRGRAWPEEVKPLVILALEPRSVRHLPNLSLEKDSNCNTPLGHSLVVLDIPYVCTSSLYYLNQLR